MFIGRGSRGLKVEKLQYRLGIQVDGIFGSGTRNSVMNWQEDNGLEPTGEMHDVDWNKMFGMNVKEWTPIGIVVHSMGEYIKDTDGSVYRARDWIKKLGYSVHSFIHTDGNVEVMKLPNQKAEHAGLSKHNGLSKLNKYFLGFEVLVEGTHNYGTFLQKIKEDDCYTDKQFQMAVDQTEMWMKSFNILLKDVVRHSDVSGDDVRGNGKGKKDPGNGFDWNRFKNELD